jgi:oxidase EvaA
MDDDAQRQQGETYRRELARYVAAVRALDPAAETPDARLEHHFECLRDWSLMHTVDEVARWFEAERAACAMVVEDIPLNEVRGWTIDPATGTVAHESGQFFTVHGVRVRFTERREAGGGWDQPILREVTVEGGILGLVRQRRHGVPHYLVEAKAEPGNYAKLQLSPTLQATFSNLRRAHGGRRPRFAELFEDPPPSITVLFHQWLSEDGGRLHGKRNLGVLVEVPEAQPLEVPPGFIWLSMHQIKALLLRDAWVNPHVRGIIAHC